MSLLFFILNIRKHFFLSLIFFSICCISNAQKLDSLSKDSVYTVNSRAYEILQENYVLFNRKNAVVIDFGTIFRSLILFGIERNINHQFSFSCLAGLSGRDNYRFEFTKNKLTNTIEGLYLSNIDYYSDGESTKRGVAFASELKYRLKPKLNVAFFKAGYRFTSYSMLFDNSYDYNNNGSRAIVGDPLNYWITSHFLYCSFGKEFVLAPDRAKFEIALGIGYKWLKYNGRFESIKDNFDRKKLEHNGKASYDKGSGPPTFIPIHETNSEFGKSVKFSDIFIQISFRFNIYYN